MLFKKKSLKDYIFLITYAVVLLIVLMNIQHIWRGLSLFINIVMPIIIGFAIAFVLNIPMSFCECHILKFMDNIKGKKLREKGKRALALILTFVFIGLLITGLVTFVIPQLRNSIEMLVTKFPGYVQSFNELVNHVLEWLHLPDELWLNVTKQWENLSSKLGSTIINAVPGIVNTTVNITQGVFNFIMGLILSIYMLADKERLLRLKDKLIYAYIPEKSARFIHEVSETANVCFHGFIAGQITEAFILGTLCSLGLAILQVPYALLIGVLVGVTSIIPIFGAFLGAVPSAFILLVVRPWYCLIFIIFIVCLQQIESNVIYPKVVGTSVGLSGLWVLIGMLLGGSLFGFTGMILGIPGFAVLYSVARTITNNRIDLKKREENVESIESNDLEE